MATRIETRIEKLGEAIRAIGTDGFAAAFHTAVNGFAESEHLTIMAYPDAGRPEPLLVSSTRSKPLIESLTFDYVEQYYRLDPQFATIRRLRSSTSAIVLRRRSQDFAPSYRQHFFTCSRVADKLSIVWRSTVGWQAINLYATFGHGCYSRTELGAVARVAPILASAASRHAEFRRHRRNTSRPIEAIAALRNARLTAREREVGSGILDGKSTRAMAQELGIASSSVHTFRKLLYRKLGVMSQAELFAAALLARDASQVGFRNCDEAPELRLVGKLEREQEG